MPDSDTPEPDQPDNPDKEDGGEADETADALQAYADAVDEGDIGKVEEAALRMMQQAADKARDNPSPWLLAMEEAHHHEAAFDWPRAEAAYKRAIEVSADSPLSQSRTYDQLAAFYSQLGQEVLALEAAHKATELARRGNMSVVLGMALRNEALLLLNAKNFAAMAGIIEEIFKLVPEGARGDLPRVQAHLLRAEYFAEQGKVVEAEADLAAAWPLMKPWVGSFFMAGWQGALAHWWGATAQLRTLRGDKAGAVEAWREVVARRRIIAQAPQLEGPYKHNWLAFALHCLGRALRENGDPLAVHSFNESRSIRRSIGLPPIED